MLVVSVVGLTAELERVAIGFGTTLLPIRDVDFDGLLSIERLAPSLIQRASPDRRSRTATRAWADVDVNYHGCYKEEIGCKDAISLPRGG
jgi:hypothetical protein